MIKVANFEKLLISPDLLLEFRKSQKIWKSYSQALRALMKTFEGGVPKDPLYRIGLSIWLFSVHNIYSVKGFQTTKTHPCVHLQFCWQSSIKRYRSTFLHQNFEDFHWHTYRFNIHTVLGSCASDNSESLSLVPWFYPAWPDEIGNEVDNPCHQLASQLEDFAPKWPCILWLDTAHMAVSVDNRDLKQTDAAAERRRSTSKFLFRRTQRLSEFIRPLT